MRINPQEMDELPAWSVRTKCIFNAVRCKVPHIGGGLGWYRPLGSGGSGKDAESQPGDQEQEEALRAEPHQNEPVRGCINRGAVRGRQEF